MNGPVLSFNTKNNHSHVLPIKRRVVIDDVAGFRHSDYDESAWAFVLLRNRILLGLERKIANLSAEFAGFSL